MGETAPGSGGNGSPDLVTPSESLQDFKRRVDRLLINLEESDAAHTKINQQKVTATAYGTGFPEANALATAYDAVHTRLQELSRSLGEQLEAMGITVSMADRDYQGIDHEHAARLQAIQARTQKQYEQHQRDHRPVYGPFVPGTEGSSSGSSGI